MWANGRGYVGDNRFEQYWNPAQLLKRQWLAWDTGVGMGRARNDFWPVLISLTAVIRWVGLTPAAAERAVHLVLLVSAGVGIGVVYRQFVPRVGAGHAIAAVVFAFNPFTAVFIVPSSLLLNYSLAPWFVACVIWAVRDRHLIGGASAVALLTLVAGATNPPGLIYALVPAGLAAVYLVVVERCSLRRLTFFSLSAAALTVGVLLPAFIRIQAGSAAFGERLAATESPNAVNIASSWAESARGLGFWLLYGADAGGRWKPQSIAYLTSPLVISATFLLVTLAILGAAGPSRVRVLFAACLVAGAALMVGSFPIASPSPLGSLIRGIYGTFPAAGVFRNSYKAGAAWGFGLAGLGALWATTRGGFVGKTGSLPGAFEPRWRIYLIVIATAVSSFPFWTGSLYDARGRVDELPDYWRQAAAWLNDQPSAGRVLVLPGGSAPEYQWGDPGDDILDALLERQHLSASTFRQSAPLSDDVIQSVLRAVSLGQVGPGVIGPIARRFNIEFILIRNDLDWKAMAAPRPSDLAFLRSDPQLRLVAAFGRKGETTSAGDQGLAALVESKLRPIEILRVQGQRASNRISGSVAGTVVDGAGGSWTRLAGAGLLVGDQPVRYVGSSSDAGLAEALEAGAMYVMTDTNRRLVAPTDGLYPSHTLSENEVIGGGASSLFGSDGSETLLEAGHGVAIRASGTGTPLLGFQPWMRPANAFDRDESSAWMVGGFSNPEEEWIEVEFATPRRPGTVRLTAAPLVSGRRPVEARVTAGTTRRIADLSSGSASVSLPEAPVSGVRVTITKVAGKGLNPVGFSDIRLAGIDIEPALKMSDQLVQRSRHSPRLSSALSSAPMRVDIERVAGAPGKSEESSAERLFDLPSPRTFDVSGALRLHPDASDALISQLIPTRIHAVATERAGPHDKSGGRLAVDGRPETAWQAPAESRPSLFVSFPPQRTGRVAISILDDDRHSRIDSASIKTGRREVPVVIERGRCRSQLARVDCSPLAYADLGGELLSSFQLEITETSPSIGDLLSIKPVAVAEIAIDGVANEAIADDAPIGGSCDETIGLRADSLGLRVRLVGTAAQLLSGGPVEFHSCAPLTLSSGPHRIRAASSFLLDATALQSGFITPPVPPPAGQVKSTQRGRSSFELQVRVADKPALLRTDQAFDPRWRAILPDGSSVDPQSLDTLLAFPLPARTEGLVRLEFPPQQAFDRALSVACALIGLCLVAVTASLVRSRRG